MPYKDLEKRKLYQKEYSKLWYEKHKEERNKQQKEYDSSRREERKLKYKDIQPEHHEYCKSYYQKHKEELKAKAKKYREDNADELKARRMNAPQPQKSLTQKWRDTHKAKVWRYEVYDLYNHTCQHCGKTNCKVNAHHIKSAKDHPELRYEITNGICLCESCHRLEHKRRMIPS